jgi:hypothetical protein
LTLTLFATGLKADVSENISAYLSNLVPGEGDTEVSIDLRENYKPDYSILAVREIEKTDNGNYFTQLSLFNTEKDNDERIVANLGIGKRILSEDKTLLTGFNAFIDYDDNNNARTSIGFEMRSAVLELTYNKYIRLDDGDKEKVLDGYDLRLDSQIPYMHWAKVFINSYEWDGRDRADIKGRQIGSDLTLSPSLQFEFSHDDKDLAGLEDEWSAQLTFVHPPKKGPSLQDGFISSSAFSESRDMSDSLLTKVKRDNKIFVEFSGKTTISRAD